MSEFKFEKGATVMFDNDHGLRTDGQVVDRWIEDSEPWYEVLDLSDPFAGEHPREIPEEKLAVS